MGKRRFKNPELFVNVDTNYNDLLQDYVPTNFDRLRARKI